MSGFVPEQRIEALAAETLRTYRREVHCHVEPPIDVDLIAEILFDLQWEYEPIQDPRTLAALHARSRTVKLNEAYVKRFSEKPGLERYTKAHEAGHWLLHVDQAVLGYGTLPGLGRKERVLCRNGSKERIERQADLFAAHLLMPSDLIVDAARQHDLLSWKSLYSLAETFGVTISALRIRLERLGLIYVDETGKINRSKAEHFGQQTLF